MIILRELTVERTYIPTPKQIIYHQSTADELLYGGAAGGGKSRATIEEALELCIEHPHTWAYCFRETYPELKDTLIKEAQRNYPSELGKYNQGDFTFYLKNGSQVCFRYCRNLTDAYKYSGAEIQWLFLDELTHFEKPVYDFLKTRLRAPTHMCIKPKIRNTTNPGGVGHGWVREYFAKLPPFKIVKRDIFSPTLNRTQIKTLQYIPAFLTDNPHLSEDYVFELEQKPEALRKALLNGDWSTFEGQVFLEWVDDMQHYEDRKWTHVIEPFEVPREWRIYRSFDFGYSKPFSCGWWASDNDGRLYRIVELYGATEPDVGVKWEPTKIFQQIREIENTHRWLKGKQITGVADPSIWDSSRGESINAMAERARVYFEKGDNTRLAGKMQLHYRLAFDIMGMPMMQVFNTCKAFIRTFPSLVYDKIHVEDVDTKCEDHAYDDARYMAMVNPIAPRKTIKPQQILDDPLNQHVKEYNRYGFIRA